MTKYVKIIHPLHNYGGWEDLAKKWGLIQWRQSASPTVNQNYKIVHEEEVVTGSCKTTLYGIESICGDHQYLVNAKAFDGIVINTSTECSACTGYAEEEYDG